MSQKYPFMPWYFVLPDNIFDGFLVSNSGNCDVTLTVIVAFSDGLRNSHSKDAANNCTQLFAMHIIQLFVERVIVM